MPLSPWLYSRSITDSTGGSLSGAVCTVALTSANFDFSLAKSDGSDLRVYDETAAAVLPSWLMDYDSAGQTATLFYKANLTSNTHSLYYGNSGASAVSSFSSVFTHGTGFDSDWGDLTTRTAGNGVATRYAGPSSANDSRNYLFWRLQESPTLSISDLDSAGVSNPGGIYTGLREFNLVRDSQNRVLKVGGKYYMTFSRRPSANTYTVDGWRAESTSKYGPWSNFTQLYTTGTEHLNYPSSVIKIGSTYYCFITYGWTNGGGTTPGLVVQLRTSTDLTTWSAPSTVLSPGVFNDQTSGACTDIGNPWVCPLADGTYMMVVEGQNAVNGYWACYGATSPDLTTWAPLNSGNALITSGAVNSWTQSGVANPKILQLPDHSFVIQFNGSDVTRGTSTSSNADWQHGYATAPAGSPGGPYTLLTDNPVVGRPNTTYGFETAHFSWDEDGKSYFNIGQRFDSSSATGHAYFLYAEQRQGGLCLTRTEDGSDAAFAGVALSSGTFTAESHSCLTAHRSNNGTPVLLGLLDGATVPNAMTGYNTLGLAIEVNTHDRPHPGDLYVFYWDASNVRYCWNGSSWTTTATVIAADHAREVVATIADDGTNYILRAAYADDGSSIFSASIAKSSVYGMPDGRVLFAGDSQSNSWCSGQFFRRISTRPYVAVEPSLSLGSRQQPPATSYTLTAPTPASGYTNSPSGNFTVTPNGSYTGSVTITPSGGGLSNPITLNWMASSAPQTFTMTPTTSGTVTLTPTCSGTLSNPSPVTYAVNARSLSVNPCTFCPSTPVTATFTGVGTRWTTAAPTLTVTGTAAAGTTIGSVVVLSDTSATALVTPGTTVGSMTFHDSTTTTTASASVAPAPTMWSYMSSVTGFTPGLVGSVGYTVLRSDGSTYAPRTTGGVFAIGSAGYAAPVPLPTSGSYAILWDDGSGHSSFEVVNPIGVEPPSAAVPGGINQAQALSGILAAVSGLASGFVGTGTSNPVFLAPDGVTARITGTVDQLGNRTGLTLSPPL